MNAYPFAVVGAEHLTDVASAYRAWQNAADREKAARMVFRVAVSDAREAGAKLDVIAGQLGVTRQAVQKVLREIRRDQEEREAEAAYYERLGRKDFRRDKEGIGSASCEACGCFKSLPSSECAKCGETGVTYNGNPFEVDEAHYGHRVLR